MRIFVKFFAGLAALTIVAIAGSAIGQDRSKIPEQFQPIFDGYKGWSPEYEQEPFHSSIYNYAIHAAGVAGGDDETATKTLSAAGNWLFTRSESQLRLLAQAYKAQLKQMFERLFISKGLQAITSKAFGSKAQALYMAWYDCIANSKSYHSSGVFSPGVLAYLNYVGEGASNAEGECKSQLDALSASYGVRQLSTDELTLLGFFSRREQAHSNNASFVSAEVLRKLVHDIFD